MPVVPLIIRGHLIEDDPQEAGGLLAPPLEPHLDRLLLTDPAELRDLHGLTVDDIVDYLVELGTRLDVDDNPHLRRAVELSADRALYSAEMLIATYREFLPLLRRPVLEELIEQNIGRDALEGWVECPLIGRTVAVRAFGARAVHMIAGNSPMIALYTVINNALARSDAIVKIPSNEPYAAVALARTMAEMAPDHPITRHFSVAYWKGGDESVERRIYDPKVVEKIVAWGGFASMRSVRRYLAPGLDLVALDPKLSASIIGADAFADDAAIQDAARRAATDIGYFNQGGCVSARVVYVQTGTDPAGVAAANRFGRRVFDELQRLPTSISAPHPAFDPVLREELDGIRYASDFRVIGGRANEGAVIVSQHDEVVDFSERLDCRVANIVPIDDVADALRSLTVHTQTIGVFPDALKAQIRDECALRGGQRIVSLGGAVWLGMAGPHDAIELLSRMVRWVRDDTVSPSDGTIAGR
ncbi:long-chain-fatty-acyl-CoA reductase [Mycolicibacterium moriokaense]|nr:long-chain-fatty-acyl-CoA reductase [Mycolicibacterium moriokaense]